MTTASRTQRIMALWDLGPEVEARLVDIRRDLKAGRITPAEAIARLQAVSPEAADHTLRGCIGVHSCEGYVYALARAIGWTEAIVSGRDCGLIRLDPMETQDIDIDRGEVRHGY